MESFQENYCLRCGSQKLKHWDELTSDEQFLVERLPQSAVYSLEERKLHLFCTLCWNEIVDKRNDFA
jgi:hypothetical protein